MSAPEITQFLNAVRLSQRGGYHLTPNGERLIYDPQEFIDFFCTALGISHPDVTDRACVITRSPAYYGQDGTVIIEWEGSPPRFPICFGSDGLIVRGKKPNWQRAQSAIPLLRRFLNAHPANVDGSPVWIGTRWKDRP